MDILIRIGIAILIALAGIGVYVAWNRWHLFRLNRKTTRALAGLEDRRAGVAAILYFTTPYCAPCKTQQRPALAELAEEFREHLQIIQVDAMERSDLADYWGVLSVPTTFIVDTQGRPRHVNHGVALAPKLRQQLREFAGLEANGTNARVESAPSVESIAR